MLTCISMCMYSVVYLRGIFFPHHEVPLDILSFRRVKMHYWVLLLLCCALDVLDLRIQVEEQVSLKVAGRFVCKLCIQNKLNHAVVIESSDQYL